MGDTVTIRWPGGEHGFRLGRPELRAIEGASGIGPLAFMQRLQAGQWRVDDAPLVLRLGLIGGGMAATEAKRIVTTCDESCAPAALIQPAILALAAGIFGITDHQMETDPAEADTEPVEAVVDDNG